MHLDKHKTKQPHIKSASVFVSQHGAGSWSTCQTQFAIIFHVDVEAAPAEDFAAAEMASLLCWVVAKKTNPCLLCDVGTKCRGGQFKLFVPQEAVGLRRSSRQYRGFLRLFRPRCTAQQRHLRTQREDLSLERSNLVVQRSEAVIERRCTTSIATIRAERRHGWPQSDGVSGATLLKATLLKRPLVMPLLNKIAKHQQKQVDT